jgi:hypothetical protein
LTLRRNGIWLHFLSPLLLLLAWLYGEVLLRMNLDSLDVKRR